MDGSGRSIWARRGRSEGTTLAEAFRLLLLCQLPICAASAAEGMRVLLVMLRLLLAEAFRL